MAWYLVTASWILAFAHERVGLGQGGRVRGAGGWSPNRWWCLLRTRHVVETVGHVLGTQQDEGDGTGRGQEHHDDEDERPAPAPPGAGAAAGIRGTPGPGAAAWG